MAFHPQNESHSGVSPVKLLFIGDIFGHAGRAIVADHLADIRSSQGIDVVIANGENSAAGFGITPGIADDLFKYGIDVITTGNHIWDKKDIYDYIGRQPRLLRPANFPAGNPGQGVYIHQTKAGARCAVMNLQGRVYMANTDCPFRKADELIAGLPADVKVRFIDFHAEVTSEKVSMGWYVDGRVSALVGTHTHIPTADTRILPGGTAYQTDCGMTGPYDSVIGVEKEPIVQKFLNAMPVRMEPAKNMVELHSVIVEVDDATGKALAVRRHTVKGD
jgi:metallophosphoesterase (TIGR00282 family)